MSITKPTYLDKPAVSPELPPGLEWVAHVKTSTAPLDTLVPMSKYCLSNDKLAELQATCGEAYRKPVGPKDPITRKIEVVSYWKTFITRPTLRTFELITQPKWLPEMVKWHRADVAWNLAFDDDDWFDIAWSWLVEHTHLKWKTCDRKWIYGRGKDYNKLPEFPDGPGTLVWEDFAGRKLPARAMQLYQRPSERRVIRLEFKALNSPAVKRSRLVGVFEGGMRVYNKHKRRPGARWPGCWEPFNPRLLFDHNVSFRETDPAMLDKLVDLELFREGNRRVSADRRAALARRIAGQFSVERGVVYRFPTVALPKSVQELVFGLIPTTVTIPD